MRRHQQSKKCQALRNRKPPSMRPCECGICGRTYIKCNRKRHLASKRCLRAANEKMRKDIERINKKNEKNEKEIRRLKKEAKRNENGNTGRCIITVSKGESECRRVLEDHFEKPFPSVRPSWMKNPVTGRNLELDCFNEELGIAVEYNGQQHYKYSPKFHRYSRINFHNQVYRDEKTVTLTKKKGIRLIVVPYTVPFDEIRSFILTRLDD